MRHVEGSKVVDAHGDFEVFLSPIVRWNEHPCVVDQDVQRCPAIEKTVRKVSNGPVQGKRYT